MTAQRNPIIDVDPFGPPLLNNMKKKAILPIAASEINDQELKTFEPNDQNNKKELEEDKLSNRPKTALPKAKSRKPQSKSKSPKRVHISSDPKDLPTKKSYENTEIIKNEDMENSIYSNDSFIEEDLLNLLD